MIKCVCGCDPEVCCCAFEQYHQPPPDDFDDSDYDEDFGYEDDAPEEADPFMVPTDDD